MSVPTAAISGDTTPNSAVMTNSSGTAIQTDGASPNSAISTVMAEATRAIQATPTLAETLSRSWASREPKKVATAAPSPATAPMTPIPNVPIPNSSLKKNGSTIVVPSTAPMK